MDYEIEFSNIRIIVSADNDDDAIDQAFAWAQENTLDYGTPFIV